MEGMEQRGEEDTKYKEQEQTISNSRKDDSAFHRFGKARSEFNLEVTLTLLLSTRLQMHGVRTDREAVGCIKTNLIHNCLGIDNPRTADSK